MTKRFTMALAAASLLGLCVLAGNRASAAAPQPESPPANTAPTSGKATDGDKSDVAAPAPASDTGVMQVERDLLEDLDNGRLGDRFMRLETPGGGFLARYEQALELPPAGAMLIVPGLGELITGHALVSALFEELPPNHWSVLSIQAPVLPREAERKDYAALEDATKTRIAAAFAYLQEQGITRIAIVAVDANAEIVQKFLLEQPQPEVIGFAVRGRWVGAVETPQLPVMELIGAADSIGMQAAEERAKAARRIQSSHRVVSFTGVATNYAPVDAAIARRLRGWLKATVTPLLSARDFSQAVPP